MFEYKPIGTCARKILFDIEDNVIISLNFISGCPGNLLGIKNLVIGMNIDEVIKRLEGIPCGSRPTSCPDQLAKALMEWKDNN